MRNIILTIVSSIILMLMIVYRQPCVAQISDTCYLATEKYYWMSKSFPDTIVFEEAVYDSVLCSYKVVAIDTNPWNYNEDSEKYNLIHVTDRTQRFMFTIVTFCEDTLDCSVPIQIGGWYNLRLRSTGDDELFWRTTYLDRTFEFSTKGHRVFIGSRTLKYRVVTTDSIKDLFYVGP